MSSMPSDREVAEHLGISESDVGAYRVHTVKDGDHWRITFSTEMPPQRRKAIPPCMMVIVPESGTCNRAAGQKRAKAGSPDPR